MFRLPNVLQPMPVQRYLIVNFVRLIGDTVKMFILMVNLMAHGGTNFVDLRSTAM